MSLYIKGHGINVWVTSLYSWPYPGGGVYLVGTPQLKFCEQIKMHINDFNVFLKVFLPKTKTIPSPPLSEQKFWIRRWLYLLNDFCWEILLILSCCFRMSIFTGWHTVLSYPCCADSSIICLLGRQSFLPVLTSGLNGPNHKLFSCDTLKWEFEMKQTKS